MNEKDKRTSKKKDELKIEVILTEYKVLKEEIKYFFGVQFTLIGIWLTFISALIGYLFSRVKQYEDMLSISDERINSFTIFVITFLLIVIIPGVCNVLGLIWLDFTTRIVKAAHYIFLIEDRIKEILCEDSSLLGWEHYVFYDSQKKKRKVINYYYHFFMLGIFFIVPPLVCIVITFNISYIQPVDIRYAIVFIAIEVFTFLFVWGYVKRILSYSGDKKRIDDSSK